MAPNSPPEVFYRVRGRTLAAEMPLPPVLDPSARYEWVAFGATRPPHGAPSRPAEHPRSRGAAIPEPGR
jgi:hypothetical protein